MKCPNCGKKLKEMKYPAGFCFECEACHGRFLSLGMLRRGSSNPKLLDDLWGRAQISPKNGRDCPSCGQTMKVVTERLQGKFIELDVCLMCQNVWFDPFELEQMPTTLGKPSDSMKKQIIPIGQRKKVKSGLLKQAWAEKREDEAPFEGRDSIDLLGILRGDHSKERKQRLRRIPWLNWSILLIMLTVFIMFIGINKDMINEFGFKASGLSRYYGLTLITSFFIFKNPVFFIVTLLMLSWFGDAVEDVVGHWKYLMLLAGAQLTGLVFHTIMGGWSTFYIGPGAAVIGIITYFSIRVPEAALFSSHGSDKDHYSWRTFSVNPARYIIDSDFLDYTRAWAVLPFWGFILILCEAILRWIPDRDNLFSDSDLFSWQAQLGGALFGWLMAVRHKKKLKGEVNE